MKQHVMHSSRPVNSTFHAQTDDRFNNVTQHANAPKWTSPYHLNQANCIGDATSKLLGTPGVEEKGCPTP